MHSPCRSVAEEESGGHSDHYGGHPHGTADACTEGTGTSHILLKPANGKLKQPLANPPSNVAPIYLRSVPDLTGCRDISATMFMQYGRSPWPVSSNDGNVQHDMQYAKGSYVMWAWYTGTGAPAAATGSGLLVAARPPRLGYLPCGQ